MLGSYLSWYLFHWFLSETSVGAGLAITAFKSAAVIGSVKIYSGYFWSMIVFFLGVSMMTVLPVLGYTMMTSPLLSTVLLEQEKVLPVFVDGS